MALKIISIWQKVSQPQMCPTTLRLEEGMDVGNEFRTLVSN
jgi:hypothetical protein